MRLAVTDILHEFCIYSKKSEDPGAIWGKPTSLGKRWFSETLVNKQINPKCPVTWEGSWDWHVDPETSAEKKSFWEAEAHGSVLFIVFM